MRKVGEMFYIKDGRISVSGEVKMSLPDGSIVGDSIISTPPRIEHGTIEFNNSKQSKIVFKTQFSVVPSITWSENNSVSRPAFKQNVSTSGFTLKFKTKRTGSIDWMAIEK